MKMGLVNELNEAMRLYFFDRLSALIFQLFEMGWSKPGHFFKFV